MSDHPDNIRPDPAALDELLRAFGLDADPDADAAASPDSPDEVAPEPVDLVIVEQEPVTEPAEEAEPAPPAVIRIDDYSGSVDVKPAAVEPVEKLPEAPSDDEDGDNDGDDDGDAVAFQAPAVIAIDDSDLPDPVYVEGNLEKGGNRSIVFIENDDTGDTLAPDAERDVRRGIEPRLRERRAAVKRAIGRKRLRWILGITVIVVVGVGTLAVLGSDLFAIKSENVVVVGAVYTDQAELGAVVDDLVGTPALLVDSQGAERRLEAIPWVEAAKVTVDFPHSVTIDIRERRAVTTYQGPDQRYRVLDREGRVLDVLDGYPIAYVLIFGPDPVDLDPGEFAPQGYAAASELARNLTASVRPHLEYMDVASDGSRLDLQLDDGTLVRFGQARDLFDKLVRLETVLAANPDREPGVIDVSTSEVTL